MLGFLLMFKICLILKSREDETGKILKSKNEWNQFICEYFINFAEASFSD